MLNNTRGNQLFTGITYPAGPAPASLQAANLTSNSLTVLNTPIVGTTIVGFPGTTTLTNVLFNNCVDANGAYIQLSSSNDAYFQGLTFFSNLYPGGTATWTGLYHIYVGTGANPPTSVAPTLNGNDTLMYPLSFANNPLTTPQVVQYYPTTYSVLGGTVNPRDVTFPQPNQLYKFNTSAAPNNYLIVAYNLAGGGVITLGSTYTGAFKVYLTYMTMT